MCIMYAIKYNKVGGRTTITPGLAILYCQLPVSHPAHTSLYSSVSQPAHTSPLTLQIAPLTTVTMQPHYQAHIYTSPTPGYIFVSRGLTPPLPMRRCGRQYKNINKQTHTVSAYKFHHVCINFLM